MSLVYLNRLVVHFISGLDLWANGEIAKSVSLIARSSVLQRSDG